MRCVQCGAVIKQRVFLFESIEYPHNPEWRLITTAAATCCTLSCLMVWLAALEADTAAKVAAKEREERF